MGTCTLRTDFSGGSIEYEQSIFGATIRNTFTIFHLKIVNFTDVTVTVYFTGLTKWYPVTSAFLYI